MVHTTIGRVKMIITENETYATSAGSHGRRGLLKQPVTMYEKPPAYDTEL
jgi:3-methyladenine DNA glycosylase Mpg